MAVEGHPPLHVRCYAMRPHMLDCYLVNALLVDNRRIEFINNSWMLICPGGTGVTGRLAAPVFIIISFCSLSKQHANYIPTAIIPAYCKYCRKLDRFRWCHTLGTAGWQSSVSSRRSINIDCLSFALQPLLICIIRCQFSAERSNQANFTQWKF